MNRRKIQKVLNRFWQSGDNLEKEIIHIDDEKDLINALFSLYDVSSRLPFKEELDKMCKDYIQTTEKEDKTKWHDNTMAEKVKHWCKWIKVFAKENGY
tara:strand:- start:124 stop:417 length:294 start_codon:yes stop_codon:yes gene_type:complete